MNAAWEWFSTAAPVFVAVVTLVVIIVLAIRRGGVVALQETTQSFESANKANKATIEALDRRVAAQHEELCELREEVKNLRLEIATKDSLIADLLTRLKEEGA